MPRSTDPKSTVPTTYSPPDSSRLFFVQPAFLPYRWGVLKRFVEQAPHAVDFAQLWIPDDKEIPEFIASRVRNDRSADANTEKRFGLRWDVIRAYRHSRPEVLIVAPTPDTATQALLALWQKLRGKSVVMWHKGESPLRTKGSKRARVVDAVMSVAVRFMDAFILYGHDALRYFQGLGVKRDRLFVAQNTVDTDEIVTREAEIKREAEVLRAQLGLEGRKIILVLATLKPAKKVERALELFARLRAERDDLALLIVGDGPERPKLERLRDTLKLDNCHITGRVPLFHDNYYIKLADLFLVTGGGGLAINQAMLLGTPVVCVDEIGSDTELVRQGETGYRIPDDDDEGMYEHVRRLIADPAQADGIRTQAREVLLAEGTVDNMARGMLAAVRHCTPHS
ncbi:MAG: glycosyltransferase family 4 protein [Gammaproteobacteria bacterium]